MSQILQIKAQMRPPIRNASATSSNLLELEMIVLRPSMVVSMVVAMVATLMVALLHLVVQVVQMVILLERLARKVVAVEEVYPIAMKSHLEIHAVEMVFVEVQRLNIIVLLIVVYPALRQS